MFDLTLHLGLLLEVNAKKMYSRHEPAVRHWFLIWRRQSPVSWFIACNSARMFVVALFWYMEYGLVLSPSDAGVHCGISRPVYGDLMWDLWWSRLLSAFLRFCPANHHCHIRISHCLLWYVIALTRQHILESWLFMLGASSGTRHLDGRVICILSLCEIQKCLVCLYIVLVDPCTK